MKLSQLAGLWSKDQAFIQFLNEKFEVHAQKLRYGLSSEESDPADLIRSVCSISSRRELDTNKAAAAVFNRDFRRPFMTWSANSSQSRQSALSAV